jgi:hypothetical protein
MGARSAESAVTAAAAATAALTAAAAPQALQPVHACTMLSALLLLLLRSQLLLLCRFCSLCMLVGLAASSRLASIHAATPARKNRMQQRTYMISLMACELDVVRLACEHFHRYPCVKETKKKHAMQQSTYVG